MNYESALVSREWAVYPQYAEAEWYHSYANGIALDMRGDGHQYQTVKQYYQSQQQLHQLPHYNIDYDYHPGPGYYIQPPTLPFLHQQRPLPLPPPRLRMNYPPARPYTASSSGSSTSTSSFILPPDLPPPPVRRMTSKVMQTSSALAAVSSTQRPRTARLLGKPALLSKVQKQANHIQSEQRRRANIRRGYAALCEAVPALREAIQEEALATDSPAAKSKTGRAWGGRGVDKVDGRSGPRSENVVLFNTIDYLNDLLVERQGLRARLERARAVLPPGHPARTPAESEPLWELEWKGGAGFNGDAEGEEDDSP